MLIGNRFGDLIAGYRDGRITHQIIQHPLQRLWGRDLVAHHDILEYNGIVDIGQKDLLASLLFLLADKWKTAPLHILRQKLVIIRPVFMKLAELFEIERQYPE